MKCDDLRYRNWYVRLILRFKMVKKVIHITDNVIDITEILTIIYACLQFLNFKLKK